MSPELKHFPTKIKSIPGELWSAQYGYMPRSCGTHAHELSLTVAQTQILTY